MNSFLKFFAWVKNNKRLKAPRARTIENRAKMLKADWFKNDITHVLIRMVSPLGRVGISFSHLATIRYTTVFHIIKFVSPSGQVISSVYFIDTDEIFYIL